MLMLAVAAGESGANPELSRNGVISALSRTVESEDLPTAHPARPNRMANVRASRLGLLMLCGVLPLACPYAPAPAAGPQPSEGERTVTIAPTAPATEQLADAPGTVLLRTLTDLTADLPDTDPGKVAAAALRGRNAASDEAELRELATEAAAGLISEDPAYSQLAARLLTRTIADEAAGQGAVSFSASVGVGQREGLIADRTASFVRLHAARLDALIDTSADDRFGYFGLRTLYSRYLLRHPITRQVIETPQHFMLRVACGLAEDESAQALDEVAALYGLMSRLDYLPSSPTLFNSGTRHPQMSSCYLLDSPLDELDSIYGRYHEVARLSKHAGGIGLSYSRIRSRGSLIRGTNGHSNGIVPFLRTLDSSVAAVNQGGRRKGAACVYLETWHADIEEFLELRDNTGEEARRTHNLNLAHWIPDEFMRRVDTDGEWSLFSPPTYRNWSTCGATPSTRRTAGPRRRAWLSGPSPRASCTGG